jgi:hypothetical protein
LKTLCYNKLEVKEMLKIPEIPNPFKLAFSSYRMTTFGKVLFGSIAAEAAYNAVTQNEQKPNRSSGNSALPPSSLAAQLDFERNPAQGAWKFYNEFLNAVNRTNNTNWWNNLSRCGKQRYIIAVCMERNLGYMVPAIQAHVFPSL